MALSSQELVVFQPGWKYARDDDGCSSLSQREFLSHGLSPVPRVVMKRLSFEELVSRGGEAAFNFFLTYGEVLDRLNDFVVNVELVV